MLPRGTLRKGKRKPIMSGYNAFTLRPETEADRAAVATLLARMYQLEGVKAIEIAAHLRAEDDYQPNHTLIAESEGKPVACAFFSPVHVGADNSGMLLALLAVTDAEKVDIMTFLTQSIANITQEGVNYVLMQGHAENFAELGFVTAESKGISGIPTTNDGAALLVKPIGKAALPKGSVNMPAYLR